MNNYQRSDVCGKEKNTQSIANVAFGHSYGGFAAFVLAVFFLFNCGRNSVANKNRYYRVSERKMDADSKQRFWY